MTMLHALTAASLTLALLLAACRSDDGPIAPPDDAMVVRASITSMTPVRAGACDVVTIRGIGLTGDSLVPRIYLGDLEVVPASVSDSSIVIRVPLSARSGIVRVIVGADTASSASALEIAVHPWAFRQVYFELEGLLVRDTVVSPAGGLIEIDTFESRWSIDPALDCESLTTRVFTYDELEDRSGGGAPNYTSWSVTAVPAATGAMLDSLHIVRQEFRYAGMLGSYRANLGLILRDVPFARELDGSIIVSLGGRVLLERLRVYDSYSGSLYEHRQTLEVLADNPEARMTIRFVP